MRASVSSRLPAFVALFWASGAIALGCEAAWQRELVLLLGASHEATGIVLGAFMSGLALGAELAARIADRAKAPLLGYAACEALVGLWAIASPWLFSLAARTSASLGPLGQALLAFALLLPPTTAMGASLPLLAAGLVRSRRELGRGLGLLYGVNLAGASAGVLFAGFVLVPRLGLRASLQTLGVAALLVAVTAALRASREPPRSEPEPAAEPRDDAVPSDASMLAVAVAATLGVVSFSLQVAYNRVLGLLLGASAYTFSLVAAAILGGLALGGLAARREPSGTAVWASVARRCLWLAIGVWIGTLVIRAAPFFLASEARRGASASVARVLLVVLVAGAPSYQIGALFPLLASRFPSSRVGATTGRALLATTLGNVSGALGTAFVVLPLVGARRTLLCAAFVSLALAALAASRAGRARLLGTLVAAVLGVALAAVSSAGWDGVALSAGTFRIAQYREKRAESAACGPSRHFDAQRLLFFREGPLATVAVIGHESGGDCALYSLRVDGKAEGSAFVAAPLAQTITRDAVLLPVGDLPTELLAGWLPGAGGPTERAFVVGWGTGFSARALRESGAGRVEAAEIEPAVLQAARVFDAAILDDARVSVTVGDARRALARAPPQSFDAIVSQPSNPWVVGSSALFSREFFELVRQRLRPGGRALVWVQLYEIDRESVRSLVATFLATFPDAHAFHVAPGARDLLLLGFAGDARTSRVRLREAFERRLDAASTAVLARAGLRDLDALMGTELAGPAALARWSAGARVATDDDSFVEFRVADRMLAGETDSVEQILAGLTAALPPTR